MAEMKAARSSRTASIWSRLSPRTVARRRASWLSPLDFLCREIKQMACPLTGSIVLAKMPRFALHTLQNEGTSGENSSLHEARAGHRHAREDRRFRPEARSRG